MILAALQKWVFLLIHLAGTYGPETSTIVGPFASQQECEAYRKVVAERHGRAVYPCWQRP